MKLRRIILTSLTILLMNFGFLAALTPQIVSADAKDQICQGIDAATGSGGCQAGGSINGIIAVIVNILSAVIGVLAVIMIIFAGYRYITSGGDSAKVSSAKNTLVYALIGLVVVALAQFIVKFVVEQATKAR